MSLEQIGTAVFIAVGAALWLWLLPRLGKGG
jgi:hypothetical protein